MFINAEICNSEQLIQIKHILIIFFLCFGFISKAQETFFKSYNLGDTLGYFAGVLETDSGYVVNGNNRYLGQFFNATLTFLDYKGSVQVQKEYFDSSGHAVQFTFDNLVYKDSCYFSQHRRINYFYQDNGGAPWEKYLLKYDPRIDSFIIWVDSSWIERFYAFHDLTEIEFSTVYNGFYTASNFGYLNNLDTLSNAPYRTGILLQKFQDDKTIIWEKEFDGRWNSNRGILLDFLFEKANGNFVMAYSDLHLIGSFPGPGGPTESGQIEIVEYDPDGSLVRKKTIKEGKYTRGMNGFVFDETTGQLTMGYFLDTIQNIGPDEAFIKPGLLALDSNYNILWKRAINDTAYFTPAGNGGAKIYKILDLDTTVIFTVLDYKDKRPTEFGLAPYRTHDLLNVNKKNGQTIWSRTYAVLDPLQNMRDVYYTKDIIQTKDSGFLFVGDHQRFDTVIAGNVLNRAWAMKTNCLGYMENQPLAGFEFKTDDSLGVYFHNTSMYAGSYEWSFGFNDSTLRCFENMDTFSLVYPSEGTYEVQLIAKGCPNFSDTIRYEFEVSIEKDESGPTKAGFTDYFNFGPNPIQSGDYLNIQTGDLPKGVSDITIYSMSAQVLYLINSIESQSSYQIRIDLAPGPYFLVLKSNGDKLEAKKLIVR
jgi:hypothetical protein